MKIPQAMMLMSQLWVFIHSRTPGMARSALLPNSQTGQQRQCRDEDRQPDEGQRLAQVGVVHAADESRRSAGPRGPTASAESAARRR